MKQKDALLLYTKIKALGLSPNEYFYLLLLKADKLSSINFDRQSVEAAIMDKGYDQMEVALSLIEETQDEDFNTFCDNYRLIFPKGLLPSGKGAKSSLLEVRQKMRWFLQTHDFTKEQILSATQKYVDHFRNQSYKYMQTASYFIYKDDKNKIRQSVLAEWCENSETTIENNENFGIDV